MRLGPQRHLNLKACEPAQCEYRMTTSLGEKGFTLKRQMCAQVTELVRLVS
jgi:hypothetical protein